MLWKVFFLSFVLCVLGEKYGISEHHIKITHKGKAYPVKLPKIESKEKDSHYGSLTHIGSKKPEHHEEYAHAYPSYEFSYDVYDPHTHDIKGQYETRDGDKVKGEYWLVQPDGRKRTVKYHADKHSGFHADVQYSDDKHKYEDKKEEEGYKKIASEEEETDERQEDVYSKDAEAYDNYKWNKGKETEAKGWSLESREVEDESEDENSSQEQEAENKDASEEKHDEDSSEEKEKGGDAEESRGQEELGKWIHNRHWGYHSNKNSPKKKYDNHESLWERKHKAGYKNSYNFPIISKPSYYGNRHEYDHEESRNRPITVRENYAHPRLYRLHKWSRE